MLCAGAGRAQIVIGPDILPLEGFSAVRDPLNVRVLVLDDGRHRIVVASIEVTSMPEPFIAAAKAVLTETTGATAAKCLVCATHTFSAPHLSPRAEAESEKGARSARWTGAVLDAIRAAAAEAIHVMTPAAAGFGTGRSEVAINRDVETADGWWVGQNPHVDADQTLTVLRVVSTGGAAIATVFSHAVQPSVMIDAVGTDGGRPVSGDLVGAAASRIELELAGSAALFVEGAAADQAPALARYSVGDAPEDAPRAQRCDVVDTLGTRLALDVLALSDSVACDPAATIGLVRDGVTVPGQIPVPFESLSPRRALEFTPADEEVCPIVAVRIGDGAIAAVQPELSAITGAGIRSHSPFEHTLVATMIDGAAKYMVDESGYERVTYGAMNSRFGRGAAELVSAGALRALVNVWAARS